MESLLQCGAAGFLLNIIATFIKHTSSVYVFRDIMASSEDASVCLLDTLAEMTWVIDLKQECWSEVLPSLAAYLLQVSDSDFIEVRSVRQPGIKDVSKRSQYITFIIGFH